MPDLGRPGFHGGLSPGFEDVEGELGHEDAHRKSPEGLKFETASATGTKGLKKRIRLTRADVLLVQETWAIADTIPELKEWARRRGWTSRWCHANPGTMGGRPSGGTAILVRDHLGLREPDEGGADWHAHRIAAGFVEALGYRPILAVSAYLQCGGGWTDENVAAVATMCRGIEKRGKTAGRICPTVVGRFLYGP